jgi:hypothetical protein
MSNPDYSDVMEDEPDESTPFAYPTFRAEDGKTWQILGPSTVCTDSYFDIQRLFDGAMSCRPVAYLIAAGLVPASYGLVLVDDVE